MRARPPRTPTGIRKVAKSYTPRPPPPPNDPASAYQPDLVLTRDQVGGAIEAHHWKVAKSMPQWPHSYTLREKWDNAIPWENVVQFLRDDGRNGWFGKAKTARVYWFFGGHVYWSMGAPIVETILINRQVDTPAPYYGIYE